jgi:hypothetical protein
LRRDGEPRDGQVADNAPSEDEDGKDPGISRGQSKARTAPKVEDTQASHCKPRGKKWEADYQHQVAVNGSQDFEVQEVMEGSGGSATWAVKAGQFMKYAGGHVKFGGSIYLKDCTSDDCRRGDGYDSQPFDSPASSRPAANG